MHISEQAIGEAQNVDAGAVFEPLYRDVASPYQVMVGLALAMLYRLPERFRAEGQFRKAKRMLSRFIPSQTPANSTRFPIQLVCFDGEAIVLRQEAAACFLQNGLRNLGAIHLDEDFNCYIAFEKPGGLERLRSIMSVDGVRLIEARK